MIRIVVVIIFTGLLVGACGRSEPESVVIGEEAAADALATQKDEESLAAPEQTTVAGISASQPAEQEAKLVKVYKSPT